MVRDEWNMTNKDRFGMKVMCPVCGRSTIELQMMYGSEIAELEFHCTACGFYRLLDLRCPHGGEC